MPVAKFIHFVWAGGRKLMPTTNIAAVKEWACRHREEGFCVRVWIDESASPGTRARYAEFGLPSDDPRIELPDITEENVAGSEHGVERSAIRYEIDRLRPNYGASSDMLRYNILAKFGGAYFDSDVNPGAMTLNGEGVFDLDGDVFRVDNNSQGKGIIGNDAFICSAGHPLMLAIAAGVAANYRTVFKQVAQSRVYDYDDPVYMQNATIVRTGPMAVGAVLHRNGALRDEPRTRDFNGKTLQVTLKDLLDDGRLVLNQVQDQYWMDNRYVQPEEMNQGNWLRIPVKSTRSDSEVLDIVQASVRFEVEQMNLLRLDDHVRDAVVSRGGSITEAGEPNDAEDSMAVLLSRRLKGLGLHFGTELNGQAVSRHRPLRAFLYLSGLVGIDDGLQFSSSMQRYAARAAGMRAENFVQMSIQFIENAIIRNFEPGFPRNAGEILEGLKQVMGKVTHAQMSGSEQFNNEYEIDGLHMTPRQYVAQVVYQADRCVAGLQRGDPLPTSWRADIGAARLYG